jgi:hypothetical protein
MLCGVRFTEQLEAHDLKQKNLCLRVLKRRHLDTKECLKMIKGSDWPPAMRR